MGTRHLNLHLRLRAAVPLILILMLILGVGLVGYAEASADERSISGRVASAEGAIPSLKVLLQQSQQDTFITVAETVTDTNGAYRFEGLKADVVYIVKVTVNDVPYVKVAAPTDQGATVHEFNFNLVGSLEGKIADSQNNNVAGLQVSLKNIFGATLFNATTGKEGEYRFESLDIGETYLAVFNYESVPYSQSVIVGDEGSTKLDFIVYEATTEDGDIQVVMHYIVLTPRENSITLYETLIYQNIGNRVFANSFLRLDLPRDRYNFTSPVMDCCLYQSEDSIDFDPMDPIQPGGQYQLWVKYDVPVDGSEHTLSRKLTYYTELFHVLVEKNPDIKVKADELKDAGETVLDNRVYQVLLGSKLEARSQTSIKVSGFSTFQPLLNDILWAAGLIAVAGITAVYLNTRRKVGKSMTSEVVGQLQREIQATEITLSQLEVDYKQGAISQEIYKTLKHKYSNRKADAQEKLKDLKMGDKPGSEEGG